MKNLKYFIVGFILAIGTLIGGFVLSAPQNAGNILRNITPEADDTYYNGTTTARWKGMESVNATSSHLYASTTLGLNGTYINNWTDIATSAGADVFTLTNWFATSTWAGGRDLTIKGNATTTGNLVLGASHLNVATSTLNVIGTAYFTGNATTSGNFTVGTSTLVVLHDPFGTGNDKVGIGTASPNNTLQVYDLIDFNNTDWNTKLGYQAGKNIVSGAAYNNFVGYQAGFSSSTASTNQADYNSAIGYQALYSNTTGYDNIANGYQALYKNTSGGANIAIGKEALYSNLTGIQNIAIGTQALYKNTNQNNTAIGYYSLNNNSSGYLNTAVGSYSLYANTTGNLNTAIGYEALYNLTGTYHDNTALGYDAGYYQANGSTKLTSASQSIYIGSGAMGFNNSDVNSIVIGYLAKGIGANSVVLGNDSILTTALKGKVGIGITSPTSTLDVLGTFNVSGNATTSGVLMVGTGTGTWAAPSSTLMVNGSAIFTGNLITSGAATTTGRLVVGGIPTNNYGNFWLSGNAWFNGSATTTGVLEVSEYATSTGGLFTQGSGHYGGSLTVDGNATTTGHTYLGTTAGLNGTYINNWTDIATLSGSDIFTLTNWFATTTWAGGRDLTIKGNATTSGTLMLGATGTWAAPSSTLMVTGNATSSIMTGSLIVNNNVLYVNANEGRVGIGTASPGYALDVESALANNTGIFVKVGDTAAHGGVSGDVKMGVFYTYPGSNSRSGLWFNQASPDGTNYGFMAGTGYVLFNSPAGYMDFRSSNNNLMRLSAAGGLSLGTTYYATDAGANNMLIEGNVGIGTTAPLATLNVSGTTLLGGNASTTGTLVVNATANSSAWNNATNTLTVVGSGLFTGNLITSGNATTTGNLVLGASHLNVATSTLNVIGTAFVTGTTTIGNANTLVVNTNEGRVGIGTASPAYPLDIFSGGIEQAYIRTDGIIYGSEFRNAKFTLSSTGLSSRSVFNLLQIGYSATWPTNYSSEIDLAGTSAANPGTIIFRTGTASSQQAETVRIDALGNVGIGLINPTSTLSVLGGADIWGSATTTGNLMVGVGNGTSWAAPSSTLMVNGSAIFTGNLITSGNATTSGHLALTGLTTDATVGLAGAVCLNGANELVKMTGAGSCVTSDISGKKNIKSLTHGLDWVLKLNPITYADKSTGNKSVGFIAQDVYKISPLLTAQNEQGKPYTVRYEMMSVVEAKAIQELNDKIIQLELKIKNLCQK